jgi:hypothetical protein
MKTEPHQNRAVTAQPALGTALRRTLMKTEQCDGAASLMAQREPHTHQDRAVTAQPALGTALRRTLMKTEPHQDRAVTAQPALGTALHRTLMKTEQCDGAASLMAQRCAAHTSRQSSDGAASPWHSVAPHAHEDGACKQASTRYVHTRTGVCTRCTIHSAVMRMRGPGDGYVCVEARRLCPGWWVTSYEAAPTHG